MRASLADLLQLLIGYGPGRTDVELAQAVYGSGVEKRSVMLTLQLLEARSMVTREGDGSPEQPYRYFTRAKDRAREASGPAPRDVERRR